MPPASVRAAEQGSQPLSIVLLRGAATCSGYGRGVRRVTINGGSGSGKSTLARRLHEALDLPYVEIDSLAHGPGWQPRPSFVDDVTRLTAGERWVIEYQYDDVRPLIRERADTFVWLDLPTPGR